MATQTYTKNKTDCTRLHRQFCIFNALDKLKTLSVVVLAGVSVLMIYGYVVEFWQYLMSFSTYL